MAEPIRVLHFADVHIGMENYGKTDPATGLSTRVVDFLRRMEEMIAFAEENEVDLVIFAGDAFKTRNPNPTFQREFAWRIQDLAKLAPVVLLVGNHDLPMTALKASSIEIYDTLRVENVLVAQDYEVVSVSTKRGDILVGMAPYPIRARLMQDTNTRGMTIAETDAHVQQVLTNTLEQMAADTDEMADGREIPRILTGHFSVSGAVWGSERTVMLGRDVQVPLSALADPRWDYVALGHIHKHQNLTANREDTPPVVYSGSLERIDFGEEGDPKGFCWVEVQRGQVDWRFHEVAARQLITIRKDCRKVVDPTRAVRKTIREFSLQGAVARVIVKLTPENEPSLDETGIRNALRDAGVFQVAGIRKEVERVTRARLATNPEGLTHRELLEQYLMIKEVSEERRDELMTIADEILEN